MEPLTISCDECRLDGTSACDDCVVSFLAQRRSGLGRWVRDVDAAVERGGHRRCRRGARHEAAALGRPRSDVAFRAPGRLRARTVAGSRAACHMAVDGRAAHEAPARHERLPTEDRWDPELSRTSSGAAAARGRDGADDALRGVCGLRSGTGIPHRAGGFPVLLPTPALEPAIPPARRRSGRWSCGPRPGASGRPCRPAPRAAVCRPVARRRGDRPRSAPGLARELLASVLAPAELVVAFGGYPADEARRVLGRRMPPVVVVPPGVDIERFRPLSGAERRRTGSASGFPQKPGWSSASAVLCPERAWTC